MEKIFFTVAGIGQIGYVANSTNTIIGDTYSAGYVIDYAVVCEIDC